jgi:dihydroorotate dehydrogenase electron transfer subunit
MPTLTRHRFDATVQASDRICREHFRLRVRISGDFPATRPGQFIQIGCRPPNGAMDPDTLCGREIEWTIGRRPQLQQPELCEPLALLRRPFSLSGRVDDANGTRIEIIHRVIGVGTHWLSDLQVGDAVDLIGPLGNAFKVPEDKSIGLLVGGGVGLPPMFYLAEALAAARWQGVGFVGAQTRDLLAVTFDGDRAAEFAAHGFDTVFTTNDGSYGQKGLITDGLRRRIAAMSDADKRNAVVFTCGPEPMMHAVTTLAAEHGIDCQVCLEQAMACGMGTCQSCVVRIEDAARPHAHTDDGRPWRYKLACTDGPVFDACEVVWV